uniref:Uncharacterized protein n=1 Tax=Acrobeloides nanus TaxID=290746 RepID=A0A914EE11_9BILA
MEKLMQLSTDQLIETQDIILSNAILSRKGSGKIIASVDIILKKLQKPTLSIYVLGCFKLTNKVLSLSMFIIWILTEYFYAYKNVES